MVGRVRAGPLRPRNPRRAVHTAQVPSFSDPGASYTVRQLADGTWACDCLDYTCRQAPCGGQCKHIIAEKSRFPEGALVAAR